MIEGNSNPANILGGAGNSVRVSQIAHIVARGVL